MGSLQDLVIRCILDIEIMVEGSSVFTLIVVVVVVVIAVVVVIVAEIPQEG